MLISIANKEELEGVLERKELSARIRWMRTTGAYREWRGRYLLWRKGFITFPGCRRNGGFLVLS